MRVSILRYFLCWALTVLLHHLAWPIASGRTVSDDRSGSGAILHTQGGVSVNSNEATGLISSFCRET